MDNYIKKKVLYYTKKFDTRNPYKIADSIGAKIYVADLGQIAGYYQYLKRHRCIYINSNLDEHTSKIVMAHELGHAILHRTENCCFMANKTLLLTSRIEQQANQFAAELLLPDTLLLEYENYSLAQIAQAECVNEELVRLKFNMENR